jgi:SAM-dependent methyltransferase
MSRERRNPSKWTHIEYSNQTPEPIQVVISAAGIHSFEIARLTCKPHTEDTVGITLRGLVNLHCERAGQRFYASEVLLAETPVRIAFEQYSPSICNICGGDQFLFGPNHRKSSTGMDPRCASCDSLERHRALRCVYESLLALMRDRSCLQFSADQAVHERWFHRYLVSVFGGQNSLDIQQIAFPDESFDFAICNHVLEHVPQDDLAARELLRILSKDGVLQFSVPDPLRLGITSDWGYPNERNHGHYRTYGADLLATRLPSLLEGKVFSLVSTDPVTRHLEKIFFCGKSSEALAPFFKRLDHCGFAPDWQD